MSRDWSREEVEAIVADYFEMLTAELQLRAYNKTEHRKRLRKLLNSRTDGSIELKHQNISAVLLRLGYPYISGYKPLSNFQQLLFDVISERLANENVQKTVLKSVEYPATDITVDNILDRVEGPPKQSGETPPGKVKSVKEPRLIPTVNYLEREARNSSLGTAGEKFAIQFEIARLRKARKDGLADKVEHVAETKGSSAGYDVHSYEMNGSDRFIEVKTTGYGKEIPFFLSKHELSTSVELDPRYRLYRVFLFRSDPRMYTLKGRLDRNCILDPTQFLVWMR